MAYFERIGESRFRATRHVGGAWNLEEQHIAPALGLLAHAVERDLARRRDDGLRVARLSYEILGTVPIGEVDVLCRVLRPGRTIELVEAELSHGSRPVVLLRAWLLAGYDTASMAGCDLPPMLSPQECDPWDAALVWPGGLIASVESRRREMGAGRSQAWVSTPLPLVAGEPVSDLSRLAGLFDVANGVAVRARPEEVAFPNIELSAHLFRDPAGAWLGYDTTVSFGPDGRGLTHSILHDTRGPFGAVSQSLTVRPRG